jgi:hypothetical protein
LSLLAGGANEFRVSPSAGLLFELPDSVGSDPREIQVSGRCGGVGLPEMRCLR